MNPRSLSIACCIVFHVPKGPTRAVMQRNRGFISAKEESCAVTKYPPAASHHFRFWTSFSDKRDIIEHGLKFHNLLACILAGPLAVSEILTGITEKCSTEERKKLFIDWFIYWRCMAQLTAQGRLKKERQKEGKKERKKERRLHKGMWQTLF